MLFFCFWLCLCLFIFIILDSEGNRNKRKTNHLSSVRKHGKLGITIKYEGRAFCIKPCSFKKYEQMYGYRPRYSPHECNYFLTKLLKQIYKRK